MNRQCVSCGTNFEITYVDLAFYQKVSPKIGNKAYEIPPPTHCPDCRQQRRLAFRNFFKLYARPCDATGKIVISVYYPDSLFPVFDYAYWWSDKWDARSFGRDFDFSKPFFEQFHNLLRVVPKQPSISVGSENCDYCSSTAYSKNCYLIGGCVHNEDCQYGHVVWLSKNCLDNLYVYRCELCYESVDCVDCYDLRFSTECVGCKESSFLHDCRNCSNCFACTGLVNKSYCFLNEQLSKEEYKSRVNALSYPTQHHINMWTAWLENKKKTHVIFPEMFGKQNESCTGNHIYESAGIINGFDVKGCEDSSYLFTQRESKRCMDLSYGGGNEWTLECVTPDKTWETLYSQAIFYSNNVFYSDFCYASKNLFGCAGLKNAQYCILNKQYSKEEYEALVPKIIEHMQKTPLNPPLTGGRNACEWGEFFPVELSPFAYNETVAQEYFPLTKEEVLARGWRWRDETNEIPQVEKIIPARLLPESINDIPDDILNWAIECEETKKPFIIQKPELEFYRKMSLPIPHLHPDVRHAKRMAKRNPRKLWERSCDNCEKAIETTYSPDRPEKVFCEECYQKAVY